MKKLLIAIVIPMFLLVACSQSTQNSKGAAQHVCTIVEMGTELTMTINSEDGEVTTAVTESREHVGELSDEDLEMFDAIFGGLEEEGLVFELDGEYLITKIIVDFSDESIDPVSIDEYIEVMEEMGAICS